MFTFIILATWYFNVTIKKSTKFQDMRIISLMIFLLIWPRLLTFCLLYGKMFHRCKLANIKKIIMVPVKDNYYSNISGERAPDSFKNIHIFAFVIYISLHIFALKLSPISSLYILIIISDYYFNHYTSNR